MGLLMFIGFHFNDKIFQQQAIEKWNGKLLSVSSSSNSMFGIDKILNGGK